MYNRTKRIKNISTVFLVSRKYHNLLGGRRRVGTFRGPNEIPWISPCPIRVPQFWIYHYSLDILYRGTYIYNILYIYDRQFRGSLSSVTDDIFFYSLNSSLFEKSVRTKLRVPIYRRFGRERGKLEEINDRRKTWITNLVYPGGILC